MDQTPIVSLAGGHPLIDIDLTVVVQFALFLILFWVANRLLFQPYLQLRERRRAGIQGAREEAQRVTRQAQAQHAGGPEAERAAAGAAGDSANPNDSGSEHHVGAGEETEDPSEHFNFIGQKPGHLLDYSGKDAYGGRFGDGEMTDPGTGRKV